MNKKEQSDLRRLDLAYACYAYVGLFIFAMVAVFTMASTEAEREGYGMGFVLPGTLLLVVFVMMTVLTIKLRSHKPLRLLGLSTLLLPIMFLAAAAIDEYVVGRSDFVSDVLVGMYACAATFVPAWWFVVGRRRYRESLQTATAVTPSPS